MFFLGGTAAAAAKSLQSCPTLCDPIDGSPPGSPVPGIPQARTLEWAAISFSNAWKWKVKVKSLSRVRLFATPWTAAHQASLSMGFSRQEHWSGAISGEESACQCRTCRRHRFSSWVDEISWRRKWQSTSVFLPGKSHGWRSLVGYSPWGCKELDTTEWLNNNRDNSSHSFSQWVFTYYLLPIWHCCRDRGECGRQSCCPGAYNLIGMGWGEDNKLNDEKEKIVWRYREWVLLAYEQQKQNAWGRKRLKKILCSRSIEDGGRQG